MAEETTHDHLLGGRVSLQQPANGFRAGLDAVLLAAAIPAEPGQSVLDVGAGSGAAALCLAARVDGVAVTGIEADRSLVRLAADNAEATGVGARSRFYLGDLRSPPIRLSPASFDHVMANPPHLPEAAGRPSPDPARARAMVEGTARLADWLDFCPKMVRSGGTVTVVHRAERLNELLAGLAGRLGGLVVLPLWPGDGKAAKRVIVAGRKGSSAPLTLLPGLVLHRPDGRYTDAAEAILRDAGALPLWDDAGRAA